MNSGEMRWGLVPSCAKDPSIGSRMINAGAETVATASAYAVDGKPLRLAGLWEVWHGAEDIRWVTCSIITTATRSRRMADIHDRQPLFLPAEVWDRWLAREPLSADEAG